MKADDTTKTARTGRKPWEKPVVVADKAVHAEGANPRHFNHDGAIACSS
jgi:hypothetical protein